MVLSFAVTKLDARGFVTFHYDYGPDSEDYLLAIRVLMKSIALSHTKYRRIVIFPNDGATESTKDILHSDGIETYTSSMKNAFKDNLHVDNHAQLLHTQNKVMLWDHPELRKLDRLVYLEPENIVLKNMDDIFECYDMCAVDNGQSVVYSNSLLVVNPKSVETRKVYSDAIESFISTGKSYGYVGVSQGFVPGIFEAFEKSPFFNISNPTAHTAASAIIKRLPFYYSINHMVYYERLNWDLYQCNNPSNDAIPGPLLSYKYGGSSVKPWNWYAYLYFNIFWHWHNMRLELNENHFAFFCRYTTIYSLCFIGYCVLYKKLCFSSPVLTRILPSTKHYIILLSVLLVAITWALSLWIIPQLMHPGYAAILWVVFQDYFLISAEIALRGSYQRQEFNIVVLDSIRSIVPTTLAQITFLQSSDSKYHSNPVQKPVVLVGAVCILLLVQVSTIYRAFQRKHRTVS